jgi:hypothetical protein
MDANLRVYFSGNFLPESKNRNIMKVNIPIKLYKPQRCYSFESLNFEYVYETN